MITAGVDIGSLSTKALIIHDDKIIAWKIIRTEANSEQTAQRVISEALEIARLPFEKIDYIVGTGYGRFNIPFAHKIITEISCHAKGASWSFPGVRTILDLGGQDAKAIKCNESGKVINYVMNDKCAAGTGRYIERIASTLEVPLEEFGDRSLEIVNQPVLINSYCTVFAQMDVVKMLRRGLPINDIIAGACDAIVNRTIALLQRVSIEEVLVFSGGVAKNSGVVQRLEKKMGIKAHIPFNPQIVGALGAAIFARNLCKQ